MNSPNGDDFIGGSLHYTTLLAPATLVIYSVYTMIKDGLYSYIYPYGWDRALIHSASLLSISGSFLAIYFLMKYLYPLARSIIALVFTIFSIHLYDFMWSFESWRHRGYGFSVIALISIIITAILLERFDNKHGMISIRYRKNRQNRILLVGTLMFIVYLSFGMMRYSGFWKAMTLYDAGLGPDPNVGNLWWFISKFLTFWLPLPIIDRRDYSVPLKIDPRVFIW